MPSLTFDERVTGWVLDRLPDVNDFGPCQSIGVVTDRLVAGVVFHGFRPEYRTAEVSIAADTANWARPHIVRSILEYPFRQLDVYALYSTILLTNERARRFNLHLGFSRPVTIGHFFGPNRHGVVTRMLQPTFEKLYGGHDG